MGVLYCGTPSVSTLPQHDGNPRMRPLMLPRFFAILAAAAALSACDRNTTGFEIVPEFDDVYSFETGMQDWASRSLDLGSPPVAWEIARTNERADDGTQSVRLRLDNQAGEGKIWIERRYEVPPDQEYEITIRFALASADHAGVAPWLVIAGADPDQPVVAADLPAGQDTGNGSATDVGHRWIDRSLVVRTKSDEDAEIFVYLGIWGRSPGLRSYNLDDVRLTFMRKGLSASDDF